MRALAILVLSLFLQGCQGLSPVVEQAHTAMDSAVEASRANYTALLAAYLRDTSAAWRSIAVDNAKAALKVDGAKPEDVLDKLVADLGKIAAKTDEIRSRANQNARNYQDYRELSRGVRGVVRAAVERKPQEDALRDRATTATEELGARAKRGGF